MTTDTFSTLSATERVKSAFSLRALPFLFTAASFYLLTLSATGLLFGWGIPSPFTSAFLAALLFGAAATVTATAGKHSPRRARIVAGLVGWGIAFTLCTMIKLALDVAVSGEIQPVHTGIAAVLAGAAAVVSHLLNHRNGNTAQSGGQQ